MVIDMNYWTKVFRRIIIFVLSILGIYLAFKFVLFYMPFLIAFVISLLLEPVIRFIMKHFKLKRKLSGLIVLVVAILAIVGLLTWIVVSLISESYNLLNGINDYVSIISVKFQEIVDKIDIEKINLPNEIISTIQNSASDLLSSITEWARGVLTGFLTAITSIPTLIIYIVITILSLYFICTDKIYMVDQLEHHLPKLWVKRLTKFIKEVSSKLGAFLKAQTILVVVSFCICLVGLIIFKYAGLNVTYPLLAAIGIAFVDALPIFGSASAMIPWAIISSLNGDITLAICLLVLLAIMAFTRQILEPKIVSGKIGIHPIFTLIAMYTGFKLIGVIGLLLGPIVLIILNNIFSTMIDKGIAKSIFERE